MNHAWISDAPRIELAHLPTPLAPLDRLSEQLGGPRIWLKRDDCTGLASGGNKTRKLEYLLADALREQANVVITFGAAQSNHARQTAAACAALGLPCHLLLARKVSWPNPEYHRAGNVLLDRLLGARVELLEPDQVSTARDRLLDELERRGDLPYLVPVGGSNAVGALGYARCAHELLTQCAELGIALTDVVHASSSAGTQAGLLAGFAGLLMDEPQAAPRVHGINVSDPDPQTVRAAVFEIAAEVLSRAGLETTVAVDDVLVDQRYLGSGYGIPTPATVDAIRLLGSTEGVLMDPVYSGKAFGGLLDRVRKGEFAGVSDVVFVHTGGSAVLPVYADAF